ncbi:methyl-accepting chemotaxis protein [Vibrio sp. D404a]|uniref:methyl-accepting chemotaxis protein n=1 Tax=unclassified Vibrio TaxID=2614977 RepID=UPI002553861D|nr:MULTISPECIES: methyl-accepting chemotaxis protein [unclassified Vibrio]MDK9737965.1 methyl-accepting chemotaxis protein [Vibrio sp. D404a]MDK9796256.1 methyl-accepting chemotaxis protein [Vibrio sp. D449a]
MVFSVVLAIAVTSAILLFIGYKTFQTNSWQAIESESRNTLHAHAKGIGDWFHDKKQAVNGLQQQISLNPDLDVVPHLRQTLVSGGFGLSYYGNKEGEMFRHDPSLNKPGYDPRLRGWYKETLAANQAITTKPYVSVTMQTLVVTLTDPVFENGQIVGIAASNLALDKLIQDVLAIPVPGDGHAILIDKQGTVVAHNNQDFILKKISDIAPELNISSLNSAAANLTTLYADVDGVDKVIMAEPIKNTDWMLVIEMDKEVLEQPLFTMLLNQITTGLVVLIVMAVATSWFVARQLVELGRVGEALADIAEGEGDLTRRLTVSSKDEVGQLADKFNIFIDRLHDMMKNVSTVSSAMTQGANHANQSAMKRSESVGKQQDEITMVATAVTEMATATSEIAANADNTAKSATHSVELSEQGFHQMEKSQASINELASELTGAVSIISELEEHGQQIATILATIREIAEQTNLLALNAAIEAARAGEQGRGFAVVADEVRVLSQRTHASTEEIEDKIKRLQQATNGAVRVMNQSHDMARTSVNDVNLAGESLEQIREAIQVISDMATQIASAAEEQSLVTAEINTNTESVREVSDVMALDASDAVVQADQLNQLATDLKQELSRFKL